MTQQPIDVYTIVTNRIIAELEKQVVPWRKPWTEAGHPQNLITKRRYTGINTWLLASLGYQQNYFLTYKQIQENGGKIKKGEKSHLVVFWKKLELKEETETEKSPYLLRYYNVFNIAQCADLSEVLGIPDSPGTISQITACEEIIEEMPQCPAIKHGKHKAFYDSTKDFINMPKQNTFSPPEAYYCTLFHELIHATGHASRLNRKEIVKFDTYGSEQYSIEELTAEMGASYLNSVAGITDATFDNNVAYINSWLNQLKRDKRLIIYAAGQAQRAVDFILNVQPEPYIKEEDAPTEQAIEAES
jgi:antirestriction protein ArdC